MENIDNKSNNSRLENSELKTNIKDNEEFIKETKIRIDEAYSLIKDAIETLDTETAYLEHIKNEELMLDLQEDIMGKRDKPTYSPEEIEKNKKEIEKIKNEIKTLQSEIDEMTLHNIHFEVFNDEFKQLQQKFNEIVTRIDPAQLN